MPHPSPCHTPSKWYTPFARYATHNETCDWHDKDGDGHLDPVELEECVLHPLSKPEYTSAHATHPLRLLPFSAAFSPQTPLLQSSCTCCRRVSTHRLTLTLNLTRYVLPRREHAGYVEEELQQLVMMLPHAAGRDGDGDGGGDGGAAAAAAVIATVRCGLS